MARSRSREVELDFEGFAGGVDFTTHPLKLPPYVLSKANNLVYQEDGVLTKRGGQGNIDSFGSSTHRVLNLHEFRRFDGSRQLLRHTSDGIVAYSTNDGDTWTNIWTGLSTSAPFDFCTFNDAVYMTNGTDDFRRWDGAAGTTYASAPKLKYLTAWKDTLWMAHAPDATNFCRIRSSAAGDATTWPATQFIDIGRGGGAGGDVTGIVATADALIVFKDQEHWAIYDPVEFTNRPVDLQKGCVSHFSIVNHDGVIYFWSLQGICVYLGDAPGLIVSQPVGAIWRDSLYDLSNRRWIKGYVAGHKVGWTYPKGSLTDFRQIEYYPRMKIGEEQRSPWLPQTRPLRSIIGLPRLATGSGKTAYILIGGRQEFNFISQADDFSIHTDSGTAFSAVADTAHFDLGDMRAVKHLQKVFLRYRGQSFRMFINRDGTEGAYESTTERTIPADTSVDMEYYEMDFDYYGRSFGFHFEDVAGGAAGVDSISTDLGGGSNAVESGAWSLIDFKAVFKVLGAKRGKW